jgi:DNA repair protein RAD57
VQAIVDSIARALARPPSLLKDVVRNGSQVITTGDATLDEMLGGGIRVGMVWEFAGEGQVVVRRTHIHQAHIWFFSGAGKTQLALQLSLLVQLPVDQGGLNGSACYFTTSASLPTPRLIQLLHEHPLLAGSRSTLDNIQTSATKSVASLLHALSEILPASIVAAKARSTPLKLLVIDSLADVVLEDAKVSTATLADRSRNLSAIAAQLHALAATHQLAVVAINRATDVWERGADADLGVPGELIYADHARLFGRAEGGGTSKKSAALGLVWANQVNARIMLARTERRHHHHRHHYDHYDRHRHHQPQRHGAVAAAPTESHDRKRQRSDEDDEDVVLVLVRRLSVVFSSVCAPASVDFIVTSRGVETLAKDLGNPPVPLPAPMTLTNVTAAQAHALAAGAAVHPLPPLAEVSPLDVGSVENDFRRPQLQPQPGEIPVGEVAVEEEDEDAYWREVDDFLFSGDSFDLVQGTDPSSSRI